MAVTHRIHANIWKQTPGCSQTQHIEELFTHIIIEIGWKLLIFPQFISNLLSWLWFLLFADVWMLFDSASWLLPPGSTFPPATKSKEPTGLLKPPSELGESLETGLRYGDVSPGHRKQHKRVSVRYIEDKNTVWCKLCLEQLFFRRRLRSNVSLPHNPDSL